MTRLRRFQELSPGEPLLFVGALLLLPLARAGLRIVGFNRTYQLIARLFPLRLSAPGGGAVERRVKATARIVSTAAAHGICGARCLPRSLVGFALLRYQGLDAQVRLGARKKASAFEAHAWIEVGPIVLDGAPDGDPPFVPFIRQSWDRRAS